MNSGLLLAWTRVTIFWVSMVTVFSAANGFIFLSIGLIWSIGVTIIAGIAGVAAYFFKARMIDAEAIREDIKPTSEPHFAVSIGKLPEQKEIERVPQTDEQFFAAFKGVVSAESYQKYFPAHAALLKAGLEVMMTKPDLPASPVRGGHGGATLIRHSLNVTQSMAREAKEWKFYGHKNKDGTLYYQPSVSGERDYHAFDLSDPLLPLAAFLHDIGKVPCYTLNKDGSVTEKTTTAFTFVGSVLDRDKGRIKKIDHDTEGAKLIRQLPELANLPHDDAKALLVALGYYHKINEIPLSAWITDRARSLVELLYLADNKAGLIEGGQIHPEELSSTPSPAISDADKKPAASAVTPAVDVPAPAPDAPSSFSPSSVIEPTEENIAGREFSGQVIVTPEVMSDDEFEVFLSVISAPDRFNGIKKDERIGYKFDGLLYITEAKLREHVARASMNPSIAILPGSSAHPWVVRLMYRLDQMGLLVRKTAGNEYSCKRSLFDTRTTFQIQKAKPVSIGEVASVGPSDEATARFVLVMSSGIMSSLSRIPNCKSAPKVLHSSWGVTAAINKKKAQADKVEATQEEQEAPVNDAIGAPDTYDGAPPEPDFGEEDILSPDLGAFEGDAESMIGEQPDPMDFSEDQDEDLLSEDESEAALRLLDAQVAAFCDEEPTQGLAQEKAGFDGAETLRKVAMSGGSIEGPEFIVKKNEFSTYFLFEVEAVMQFYGIQEGAVDAEVKVGGSHRRYYLIEKK